MAKPIRVAQVLNRMDSGGIEAVVMNYYRHIDRSQIQFDFYFAEDSFFPQQEELERLGAGIYKIPRCTRIIAYQQSLHKLFRENGYPVVHAHLSTLSVFSLFAAWRAGVPVRICHNHSTADWGEGQKTLLKYLLRPFNKLFANRWFACGELAGRWMYGNKAFEQGKVTVLPNAIDIEKFAYEEAARHRLRQELGIAEDAFVLGHVGRFMYQKNHPYLIDIFEQLLIQKPTAVLLLVGEGDKEAEIHELIAKKGLQRHVVSTGARQDVNQLYSAMDVFCLPSHYEGFPVVILEALAAGLSCLCSDAITHEMDSSPRVIHLPTHPADIPAWVETIQEVPVGDARTASAFDERFNIAQAAKRYQTEIEEAVIGR